MASQSIENRNRDVQKLRMSREGYGSFIPRLGKLLMWLRQMYISDHDI